MAAVNLDRTNLTALRFHSHAGDRVRLDRFAETVERVDGDSPGNSYVFTERPIKIGQQVCIIIEKIDDKSCEGDLGFGVTSLDPAKFTVSLLPKDSRMVARQFPHKWYAFPNIAESSSERCLLVFFLEQIIPGIASLRMRRGSVDAKPCTIQVVEARRPLWMYWDLRGRVRSIRIAGIYDLRPSASEIERPSTLGAVNPGKKMAPVEKSTSKQTNTDETERDTKGLEFLEAKHSGGEDHFVKDVTKKMNGDHNDDDRRGRKIMDAPTRPQQEFVKTPHSTSTAQTSASRAPLNPELPAFEPRSKSVAPLGRIPSPLPNGGFIPDGFDFDRRHHELTCGARHYRGNMSRVERQFEEHQMKERAQAMPVSDGERLDKLRRPKADIHCVLVACQCPMTPLDVTQAFFEIHRCVFHPEKYGFKSMQDFLDSCPDKFRCTVVNSVKYYSPVLNNRSVSIRREVLTETEKPRHSRTDWRHQGSQSRSKSVASFSRPPNSRLLD